MKKLFFTTLIFSVCLLQGHDMKKKTQDWDGQYYQKYADSQFKSGMAILEKYSFNGDEAILDVGCGDGRITAELAKRLPKGKVVGLDVSPGMIDTCKKTAKDLQNMECVLLDAADMTFDNEFNFSICFSAFHWMDDQQKVLDNIYKALKHGGRLIIKARVKEVVSSITQEFTAEFEKWKYHPLFAPQGFYIRSEQEYQDMLAQSGFADIQTKVIQQTKTYKNKQGVIDWLMTWVPYSTGLPTKEATEFAQGIVERLWDKQDGDQTFEYASGLVIIDALKK